MGTDRFPGFYLSDSGFPVDARWHVRRRSPPSCGHAAELGTDHAALVVANPLPVAEQVDPALHDRLLDEGLAAADAGGRARQGGHPVPPGALPPARAAARACAPTSPSSCGNASLAARIAVAAAR